MNSRNLLVLIAVFASLLSQSIYAEAPKVFDAEPSQIQVYANEKFASFIDGNKFNEIVVSAKLTNTCQKLLPTSTTFDRQSQRINLHIKIAEFEGCKDLPQTSVTFIAMISLFESLTPGTYDIDINGRESTDKAKLIIGADVENKLLNHGTVTSVDFVQIDRNEVVRIGGNFNSSNLVLDKIELEVVSPDILVVYPKVKESLDNTAVVRGVFAWNGEFKLPAHSAERLAKKSSVLIHVREQHVNYRGALIQGSINKLLQIGNR